MFHSKPKESQNAKVQKEKGKAKRETGKKARKKERMFFSLPSSTVRCYANS